MKKISLPMQWYQEHINWMIRVIAGVLAVGSCLALSDDIFSLLDEYSLELTISVVLNVYFILVMCNVFFYGHTPKHWKNMDEAKKQLTKKH